MSEISTLGLSWQFNCYYDNQISTQMKLFGDLFVVRPIILHTYIIQGVYHTSRTVLLVFLFVCTFVTKALSKNEVKAIECLELI